MNDRQIVNLPCGKDDLFTEPAMTPTNQKMFDHNRERFEKHFNYADPFSESQKTYDQRGNYNCGRCNQADGNNCLLLKLKYINRKAGSCGDWERIEVSDPELRLKRKDAAAAVYGVAKNGEGFGCHRCPFSKLAKNKDNKGRTHWCGYGAFHNTSNACCSLNGAATV